MTIVAVSCIGKDLSGKIDSRFGRAESFLLVDLKTMKFEHIDNSKIVNIARGAGIKTAEMLSKKDVKVVLTGSIGPKAESVLEAAKIKVICGLDGLTVKDALKKEEKRLK
jgi:predicted Fe-Mo cluster-binding NifX family protein